MHPFENKNILIYFAFLYSLAVMDVSIYFNIPIIREIFCIANLLFIPGILINSLLKVNTDSSGKFLIFSIGSSLSFLLILGLLINEAGLFFNFTKPLEIWFFLPIYNIFFLLLLFASFYKRIDLSRLFMDYNVPIREILKDYVSIALILFAIFAIISIEFFEYTNVNILLIILLLSLPLGIAFIMLYGKRSLYSFYLVILSLIIVLILSLRTPYLIGSDLNEEYLHFAVILKNLYWVNFDNSLVGSCIAVTLLPTIIVQFTSINPVSIYKVFFPLIFVCVPVIIYYISKKYFTESIAFLSGCFFILQINFIWAETNPRTNIAIFFCSLILLIFFDDNFSRFQKSFYFIIFCISMVFSHYTSSYIFFGCLLFVYILQLLGHFIKREKKFSEEPVKLQYIIIFLCFIFFWNAQVATGPAEKGIDLLSQTISQMGNLFSIDSKNSDIQLVLGSGSKTMLFPETLHLATSYLIIGCITLGLMFNLINLKYNFSQRLKMSSQLKPKNDYNITLFGISFFLILLLFTTLPRISISYGTQRIFHITLLVLSIFFILGIEFLLNFFNSILFAISKFKINDQELLIKIVTVLIITLYSLSIFGLTYYFFDDHRYLFVNTDGFQNDMYIIKDNEKYALDWIVLNKDPNQAVISDFYTTSHLMFLEAPENYFFETFDDKKRIYMKYFYLRLVGSDNKNVMTRNYYVSIYHKNIKLNSSDKLYSNSIYSQIINIR